MAAAAGKSLAGTVRGAKALVFDAYGTLFDVAAAARGADLGPIWPRLADAWRAQQLQATWLRNSLPGGPAFVPFWQVTKEALDIAMRETGVDGGAPASGGSAGETVRDRLLSLYSRLEAYPDVAPMLDAARAAGKRTAILSNGSPKMLADAIDGAGIGSRLDAVVSASAVRVYKPDRRVYAKVCEEMGLDPHEVLFVSSNNWDVKGAAAFGFRTLWCNRSGGAGDAIPGEPDHVVESLAALGASCAE